MLTGADRVPVSPGPARSPSNTRPRCRRPRPRRWSPPPSRRRSGSGWARRWRCCPPTNRYGSATHAGRTPLIVVQG